MKKISFLIALAALSLGFTNETKAFSIETATDVRIVGQKVEENTYVAGGSVTLNSEYTKDVFVAGGDVEIAGKIAGDLIVMGGETRITGQIAGDVRVIGGRATISGEVLGDLFIVAGKVDLINGAKISGESIFVTAEMKQLSILEKPSKILAGAIFLNSTVASSTEITTQKIVIGSLANITGELRYFAPNKAEVEDGSKITGDVSFNEIKTIRERGVVKSTILNLLSFWIIFKFLTTLILAFIATYVFRIFAQRVTDLAVGSIVRSFFSGIGALILIPIISIILLVSLIALPIGFLFMLAYVFILIISPAISGVIIGTLLFGIFEEGDKHQVTFGKSAVGIVLLTALQFVPVIGDLTKFVFTIIAFGAITRYTYGNVVR